MASVDAGHAGRAALFASSDAVLDQLAAQEVHAVRASEAAAVSRSADGGAECSARLDDGSVAEERGVQRMPDVERGSWLSRGGWQRQRLKDADVTISRSST